jgi:hypothetical protein
MKHAIQPHKSLQISQASGQLAALWEKVNALGLSVIGRERKVFRDSLIAGAWFSHIKSLVPDGDWEVTFAAHSKIPARSARRWMQNVSNVLLFCAIPEEERAYQALIGDKDDDYTRAVLETITDAIDGKTANQLQLELSARSPKKKTPALPAAEQQAERDEVRLRSAEVYVGQLEDLLRSAPSHGEVFDDALLNRFNTALKHAYDTVNKGFHL